MSPLDISIPSDVNTSLKTYEKLSKYKGLEIELGKSWKVQVKTIPVIIGALGAINKNTKNYKKRVTYLVKYQLVNCKRYLF